MNNAYTASAARIALMHAEGVALLNPAPTADGESPALTFAGGLMASENDRGTVGENSDGVPALGWHPASLRRLDRWADDHGRRAVAAVPALDLARLMEGHEETADRWAAAEDRASRLAHELGEAESEAERLRLALRDAEGERDTNAGYAHNLAADRDRLNVECVRLRAKLADANRRADTAADRRDFFRDCLRDQAEMTQKATDERETLRRLAIYRGKATEAEKAAYLRGLAQQGEGMALAVIYADDDPANDGPGLLDE